MIKDIRYKGYTANPSDYECEDGELAMSLNVIHEDGSLKPVMQPSDVMQLSNAVVKCIHKTSTSENYIIIDEHNDLVWRIKENDDSHCIMTFDQTEVYQITPIGNTLVAASSDGMYYFLWQGNNYKSLGNEIPELYAKPYISTDMMNTTTLIKTYNVSMNHESSGVISGDSMIPAAVCKDFMNNTINTVQLAGTARQYIYDKVFGILNYQCHFLKDKGYFLEPFYVRFAYRMYDGSHVRHTVPVLMVPSTWGKPFMNVNLTGSKAIFDPIYSCSKLHAIIQLPDNIEMWSDIITDIDIFVTEPLTDYSDSPESLLALKKYPWKNNNDVRIPKAMTIECSGEEGTKKMLWKNIPDVIKSLQQNSFIIMPFGQLKFEKNDGLLGSKNGYCNYTLVNHPDMIGYFAINGKGAYDFAVSGVTGQQGVAEVQELDWLKTSMDLTFFKLEDLVGMESFIIYTDQELGDDEVYFDTYVIFGPLTAINSQYYLETKRVDGKNYHDILTQYSSFYHVGELSISDIKDGNFNGLIPIKDKVLTDIVVSNTLSDTGQQHNQAITKSLFGYNNRLNIILEEENLRNPATCLTTQNPAASVITTDDVFTLIKKAYVEIYENAQYAYVEIPVDDGLLLKDLSIFSFPHNNAKNLILYGITYRIDSDLTPSPQSYQKYTVRLKCHGYLNLAYAFNMFNALETEEEKLNGEDDFAIPSGCCIKYGNILRLSDINNPFRFSEEYTCSLPVDRIYALATAAKALSQGQFGQYPLYAFTSDGIWALEVSSVGAYSARQPISRDKVVNPNSITQIDNSVLFATARGIMLISGSQVICISDSIDTLDTFAITKLPKTGKMLELYGDSSMKSSDIALLPLKDFIAGCRMIYDYVHQHIIVYNPNIRYAYVYSLKSQLWGMMTSDIKDNVNSYPEALAMTNDNRLVDFSVSRNGKISTMIVTRPISMGQPNVLKTARTIIQRGNMNNSGIGQVLYGSNDLQNWFLIRSSDNIRMGGFSGSPWKYYRLCVIRDFDKSESLYGFSIQYEPKYGNRLR